MLSGAIPSRGAGRSGAAKRMVARSGTYGEHVTFWTYSNPGEPALGRYFVKVLRELGYRASLRVVPGDRYW